MEILVNFIVFAPEIVFFFLRSCQGKKLNKCQKRFCETEMLDRRGKKADGVPVVFVINRLFSC